MSLGPDMAERVSALAQGARSEWVALWPIARDGGADEAGERVAEIRRGRGWAPGDLILMYSGNMGLGHRFDEFLGASLKTGEGVRWAFFGEGRRRVEVEDFMARHPSLRVERHGYVPHAELPDHLRTADIHLSSLDPAWDGTMVPSKLQGIAACGRPVLFVGSRTSAIGRWIEEAGAGWVVAPGDVPGLLEAVEEGRDPEVRQSRGRAAAAMARACFDEGINSARVSRFFSA
jgi:glycosyltransferase involved in cell wall biosynthesis